jgi:hypothetical protein
MKKAVQKAAAPEASSTATKAKVTTGKAEHYQGHHRATPAHPEDRPLPDGLGEIDPDVSRRLHPGIGHQDSPVREHRERLPESGLDSLDGDSGEA